MNKYKKQKSKTQETEYILLISLIKLKYAHMKLNKGMNIQTKSKHDQQRLGQLGHALSGVVRKRMGLLMNSCLNKPMTRRHRVTK